MGVIDFGLGSRPTSPTRSRLGGAALVALVVVALAGCSQEVEPASGPTTTTTTQTRGQEDPCAGSHWVAAWRAAPSGSGPTVSERTLRMVVTPHVGGRALRLQLTNRYGTTPLVIRKARVARRTSDAATEPGSSRPATFDGKPSITVPPGGDVVSDDVPFTTEAFEDLAVTLYIEGPTGPVSEHFIASETASYTAPGDHVADTRGVAFGSGVASWYLLAGIDVLAPMSTVAVVAFGDSITDGFLSTVARSGGVVNSRYPDVLARRFAGAHRTVAVANQGISSNRLLSGPSDDRILAGTRGLDRLADDVLSVPGATDVVVLLGINDLRLGSATADDLIEGLTTLVAWLHRADLDVTLGTYPPVKASALVDASRRKVNTWIRTSDAADHVVDFDAALRNDEKPWSLAARYDSGDGVHPNARGYEAMAGAVDLGSLGSTCSRPASS